MEIRKRVELYKSLFGADCKALEAVKGLNTELSNLYMVSLPAITVWVRDTNYVAATGEVYLTEPELEPFLHCFRHHLQNVERKYERRGLTTEDKLELAGIPYKDTVYKMWGEDDAVAWSRFLIELSSK